jgi:hypothetical protein
MEDGQGVFPLAHRFEGCRENYGTSLTETYLCDPDSRLVAPF